MIKNKKLIALTAAIISIITIGGITAYFTDSETKENIFVIGSGVNIKLNEDFPCNPPKIKPNGKQNKNPKIVVDKNSEDCYAFIEYTLPTEKINIFDVYGKTIIPGKSSHTYNELFTLNKKDGSCGINKNSPNSDGWLLLKGYPKENKNEALGIGTKTYVYAYVNKDGQLKALKPGSETTTIFDSITFANVNEKPKSVKTIGQTNNALSIPLKAYAIQTENIVEHVTPENVWNVLKN